jgi:hypothetical protein
VRVVWDDTCEGLDETIAHEKAWGDCCAWAGACEWGVYWWAGLSNIEGGWGVTPPSSLMSSSHSVDIEGKSTTGGFEEIQGSCIVVCLYLANLHNRLCHSTIGTSNGSCISCCPHQGIKGVVIGR